MRRIFSACLCIALLIFTACDRENKATPPENNEVILARIGDKTITVNEFIRRAEYTVRPPYCRGDNPVHKKIVLNSLIAEKLLALEAGEENELVKNEHFQRYLQGRQEQAMRQVLQEHEGVNKVVLDTSVIKRQYALAGRTYRLQFITLRNDSVANMIKLELDEGRKTFEQAAYDFTRQDSIATRGVAWQDPEPDTIHEALFSDSLKINQIIGPVPAGEAFLILKILGWTDRVAITESQVQQRWNEVTEKWREKMGAAFYVKFVSQAMKGKRIEFEGDTFSRLATLLAPIYFNSKKETEEAFLGAAFSKNPEVPGRNALESNLQHLRHQPLFRIDGRIWTVGDLELELERHPLVFRKKRFSKREFPEQLKLAIVDVIRDRYLTAVASQRGYDKEPAVTRCVAMWQDAEVALFRKHRYLRQQKLPAEEKDTLAVVTRYLNAHIDSLQQKYAGIIEVNVEAFNRIQLSRIDMFVRQDNVPFPIYVPSFPQLTTNHKLDYGRKMERVTAK
jgi:hypothetical protein